MLLYKFGCQEPVAAVPVVRPELSRKVDCCADVVGRLASTVISGSTIRLLRARSGDRGYGKIDRSDNCERLPDGGDYSHGGGPFSFRFNQHGPAIPQIIGVLGFDTAEG
jgi:hypothetical protein